MTNREIAQSWERAEKMAERIYGAYITGIGTTQAIKDQKSLAIWLNIARESGLVYNGSLDEYITMKL